MFVFLLTCARLLMTTLNTVVCSIPVNLSYFIVSCLCVCQALMPHAPSLQADPLLNTIMLEIGVFSNSWSWRSPVTLCSMHYSCTLCIVWIISYIYIFVCVCVCMLRLCHYRIVGRYCVLVFVLFVLLGQWGTAAAAPPPSGLATLPSVRAVP